jgi:hypothetical protein
MNFGKAIDSQCTSFALAESHPGQGIAYFSSMSLVTTIWLLRSTMLGTAIWSSTSSLSKPFVRDASEPFVVPYCMATVFEVGGRRCPRD